MNITDFINNDLKQFSNYDNVRSIPSIVDGFKDAQRKAIHGMRKFGVTAEKISRSAGNISILTDYLHGESSMQDTIINLAQTFPGSNNINLLEPLGQFGSILNPQSASPRYISTKKSDWFDKIIKSDDDIILEYKKSEDLIVEPIHFYPTLPLWLINGCIGIGTGHSVKIASRNHKNIIKAIKCILNNKPVDEKLLYPFYNNWKGSITKVDDNSYELTGCFEIINTTTIRITELPIGFTHNKYKEHLIGLMDKGIIKDYDSNSTEESFDFVLSVPRELTKKPLAELLKVFKLVSRITDNITLWDKNNALRRFESIESALVEWVEIKLESLSVRRNKQLEIYASKKQDLEQTIQFIETWNQLSETNNMMKLTEEQISDKIYDVCKLDKSVVFEKMKMPIRSLTMSRVNDLKSKIQDIDNLIQVLETSSNKSLFIDDLKI